MRETMSVREWVFDVLAYQEAFSFEEICYALEAKSSIGRNRISRNLSYLVKKGLVEKLERGTWKNLKRRPEFSARLGEIGYSCFPREGNGDGKRAAHLFLEMKHTYKKDGFIFEKQNLWRYEGETAIFYKAYNPSGNTDYLFNTQCLLLIREDDPERDKVVRYVGRKAEGVSMFVYQDGNEREDVQYLFPNAPWLF